MNIPSLIFWLVFVLPFAAFLIWLMRQDKNKKTALAGLIVVAILLIGGIIYMYLETKGK